MTVSELAGRHVGLGKMSIEYEMPRLGEEPLFRGRSEGETYHELQIRFNWSLCQKPGIIQTYNAERTGLVLLI